MTHSQVSYDSFTHYRVIPKICCSACPESFDEFYNQRRRWMPSTMLNILDLLQNWKLVTAQNEDISFLYIFYQVKIVKQADSNYNQ